MDIARRCLHGQELHDRHKAIVNRNLFIKLTGMGKDMIITVPYRFHPSHKSRAGFRRVPPIPTGPYAVPNEREEVIKKETASQSRGDQEKNISPTPNKERR